MFYCHMDRFHPVVGGGANGSVIHYSRNDRKVHSLSLSLRGHLKSCFAVKFNAAVLTDQNR
jgi:Xaa-Pro aminopeptidase